MNSEMPKDWKWVKLSEVCDIRNGKNQAQVINPNGKYPIYGSSGVFGYSDEYLCEAGTTIIGRKGTINSPIFVNTKFWNVDTAFGLSPKENYNNKLLYYFCLSFNFHELDKSTTIPSLAKRDLLQIDIPLPPEDVQQAIVSKIEELFSELDKSIETLRLAQQQLKTYRQAVLKWAFINEKFRNFVLADITEKIQIGPFGTQLHKEDYIENGIPLINPTHIKDGFIVADKSFSILESKRNSLPNYILEAGDVVMGRRGEMGRCGLVTKKEAGWFCGTGSLYFRPNREKINPIFLYYNLRSEPVKKYLDDNAGGTTMANLNLKIVKGIPISLPSINDQNQIVQEIESRLSVADKMEESIIQSLQQADALRQSILKKAFEGQLNT